MENKGFIYNLLNRFAATDDKQVAFSIYDGNQLSDITYQQFLCDILKTAGYFAENGIQNQHIALVAPNSYEWIVTFFGVLASGNVAVLLNPHLPASVLKQQVEQADVTMIWSHLTSSHEIQAQLKHLQWLDINNNQASLLFSMDDVYCAIPDETVVLLSTSGTTGKSKVVEITSHNLQYRVYSQEEIFTTLDRERFCQVLPTFHIAGLLATLSTLNVCKTLCLGRGITYILTDIPVLNPTVVCLVPSMAETFLKIVKQAPNDAELRKRIGTNLRRIILGGASINPQMCISLINLGFSVETGYALTETTGDGTWCDLCDAPFNSVGKVCGDMQGCIQNGEILLKGPSIMKGYYKDPEETMKIIEDGWLHTGDMGYCDENGYYYITGRKKNVIILSNGENVNPEEIEAAWGKSEYILECMVYSDGKGICADVYTENEKAAASYIREYNDNMPLYRQVYKVSYSAVPLEKTSTGKIKRKENK